MRYLNMIRERAGVVAYTSADLSSKYQFREAVRNERRLGPARTSAGST